MVDSGLNIFNLNARPILYSCLFVVVFALIGAQVWLRYSEKTKFAQNYLESNAEFLQTVGDIKGYGLFITHSIERNENSSYVGLFVRGKKVNKRVRVYFERDRNREWQVDHYELR